MFIKEHHPKPKKKKITKSFNLKKETTISLKCCKPTAQKKKNKKQKTIKKNFEGILLTLNCNAQVLQKK